MKICFASMNIIPFDIQKNLQNIRELVLEAKERGANLLLLPEMCLSGYFLSDTWERLEFIEEIQDSHVEISQMSTSQFAIIFGSLATDKSKCNEDGRIRKYNAAYCSHNGKWVVNPRTHLNFWPKTLLPNYEEFDDSRHFFDLRKLAAEFKVTPDSLLHPVILEFESQTVQIGVTICEDAWHENYTNSPMHLLKNNFSIDFFVNLSCSPFAINKQKMRQEVFSKLSLSLDAPVIYVNCSGTQASGKTVFGFDGHSGFYVPHDNTVLQKSVDAIQGAFQQEMTEVLWDKQHPKTLTCPSFKPTKEQEVLDTHNTNQHFYASQNSFSHTMKTKNATARLTQALEFITTETLKTWRVSKVAIGISGGIDSAVSACLFQRILGPKNVFLVNMPTVFNSKTTQNAARQLAGNLGCPYMSIPIQVTLEQHKTQLLEIYNNPATLEFAGTLPKTEIPSTVFENMQSRERGARVLGAIAAITNSVFVCNTNKTEMCIGYGTLYGDLTGFLAPLADLWKYQIYDIASHYNEHIFCADVIPKETLEIVPSAELSNSQDVDAGLGDPLIYPYHDKLFCSWVEHKDRKTPLQCLQAYLDGKLGELIQCDQHLIDTNFRSRKDFVQDLEKWWSLHTGLACFKRFQSPPVIALSGRTFGTDLRETALNGTLSKAYLKLKKDHGM